MMLYLQVIFINLKKGCSKNVNWRNNILFSIYFLHSNNYLEVFMVRVECMQNITVPDCYELVKFVIHWHDWIIIGIVIGFLTYEVVSLWKERHLKKK